MLINADMEIHKCKREHSMFRHKYLEYVTIGESLIEKDSIWNVVDESDIVDEETTKKDDENMDMTFQNPSPSQEINVVEEETNKSSPALVRCDQ